MASHLKILPFLLAMALTKAASAEFICTAELSYQWKKESQQELLKGPPKLLRAKGADEAAGKATLNAVAATEKGLAIQACQKDHENLSACISTKMSGSASVLQSLGFASRKALEEAITADCKFAAGTCKDPILSEPQCAAEPLSAAEAEQAAKDEKAKKKK
jgi:hypothetical protein